MNLKKIFFFVPLIFSYSLGYQLNFSNMNKLKHQAIIQSFSQQRVTISNEILHISMAPTDGDGLTKNSRNDGDRQRNEVSININDCVIKRGETLTYKANIKLFDDIHWNVNINAWYHIFQIKKWGRDRPLLTIGIKDDKLVLYKCDGYGTITIGDINNYWSDWISFTSDVTINSNNIILNYNINGHSDKIICTKDINSDQNYVYLKLGQYRSYPNPIHKTTEILYKNVMCIA